jgi:phospholipase C
VLALAAAVLALAAPCSGAKPPAHYEHVVWIWMENKSYGDVIGNAAAPYENRLARECATATNYSDLAHPSLPNYIGATSGFTWGISDDGPPAAHPLGATNVFGQATTWRAYMEGAPGNCATASSGRYTPKHDPVLYYTRLRAGCRRFDVPFTQLASDLRQDRLPQFALIVPDLCHDTHDCPPAAGDAWLARVVPMLLASRAYRSGATAIFVVWDEGTRRDSHVPFLALAPSIPAGRRTAAPFDHYSLLRTTEELLGLPLLLKAQEAASMTPALRLR